MTEQELNRELRSYVGGGGMINISQLSKFMNCGRDTAKAKYLKRLIMKEEFIQAGKKDKKFFIKDVVKEIMAVRGARI
ncbi:MAG: hypothetical protein GX671_05895 [Clostridiales bacterium]|nr:hypothetical protein [Clostridiales bacterium]